MVAAAAAPCGGTGRKDGGRGGAGRAGASTPRLLGARRERTAKNLTPISVAVWHDLSRRRLIAMLRVLNQHACAAAPATLNRYDERSP